MTPCPPELKNYQIAHDQLRNNLAQQRGIDSWQNANVQIKHQISVEAAQKFRPVFHEGQESSKRENSGIARYQVRSFTMRNDGEAEFTDGAFAGTTFSDLDRSTQKLRPDLYQESDALTNIFVQELIANGASDIVTTFHQEGQNNRDLSIFHYDHEKKIGTLTMVNTAPDGQFHTFQRIKEIAEERSSGLNQISPDSHVFLLADKIIPERQVSKIVNEFKIKEQELQIKETQMRFDHESGKVFTKGKNNKEIDFEIQVCTEEERRQKHRLVRKIESCANCATKTKKTEAFLYAHDNEFSQIKVDSEGKVIMETITLPKFVIGADLNRMLLQLGYVGPKTPNGFSYVNDPFSQDDLKNAIQNELNSISNRSGNELLFFQVFPIMAARFDFLRERLNSDRIIDNNSMYLHDIVVTKRNTNEKNTRVNDGILQALLVFGSNENLNRKIKLTKIGEKSRINFFEGEESGKPKGSPNLGGAEEALMSSGFEEKDKEDLFILNHEMELHGVTHRKKRESHQGSSDDNGGKPPPTADSYVEDNVGNELSVEYKKQENGKPNPKNSIPQSPTKMYLEEENSPLFQEDDQGRHLVREEIIIKQKEETTETTIKREEQTSGMLIENTQDYHYYDLNHDSEQAQNIVDNIKQLNMESDDLRRLIFPVITRSLPIGERVDLNEKYQAQMEQIWAMFLNLYFGIQFGDARKEVKSSKSSLKFVAEQEVRSPINFFNQTQFLPYMRVFAILLICILKLSKNI